jgi:hypothetical protein
MHLDHYAHPEFGWLSPTPRLRRELRTAFLAVLFGIGIGAAAVIELNGYKNAYDEPTSRGVSSEELPGAVAGYNTLQTARTEDELNKDHTSKPDGSTADANSKNRKTNPTTTCEGNNSSCLDVPPVAGKLRGMRMPTANDALAIGRIPLGHSDASAGMTSAAPSEGSERAPENTTSGRPQQRNADDAAANPNRADSNRLSHKKPYKTARSQNPSRQGAPNEDRAAYWVGRGYDRPVGELGRTFAHDRSYGQKGFWDWSR